MKQLLYHLYHIVTNFPGICAFIIGFSFTVWTKKSAKKKALKRSRIGEVFTVHAWGESVS